MYRHSPSRRDRSNGLGLLHGPWPPTWAEHDALHPRDSWSSSQTGRYVLDDYDEQFLFCHRCGMRVWRPAEQASYVNPLLTEGVVAMQKVPRGARINGTQREKLACSLASRYERGASIRQLAEQSGRSFGTVRRLLCEAGVQLRPRGKQPEVDISGPPILSRVAL
jgi:hypothetical protein